jgi:hypothetical protein
VWGPFNLKKHYFKTNILKIRNLEHKYKTMRAQLLKKPDVAQSSIERKLLPPKDIGS